MDDAALDIRNQIAFGEASFFYPAVPEEQLGKDPLLLTSYRRTLGSNRIMACFLGFIFVTSVYGWVKDR